MSTLAGLARTIARTTWAMGGTDRIRLNNVAKVQRAPSRSIQRLGGRRRFIVT